MRGILKGYRRQAVGRLPVQSLQISEKTIEIQLTKKCVHDKVVLSWKSVCLLCISGISPFISKQKTKERNKEKEGRDAVEGYLWDTCCDRVGKNKINLDSKERLF